MRATHTYALLEVSDACYEEIKHRMLAVEYKHAINSEGEIDMHGIALVKESDHTGKAKVSANVDLPACPRCKSLDLARRGTMPVPDIASGLATRAVTNFDCQKCALSFTSDDLGKDFNRRKQV